MPDLLFAIITMSAILNQKPVKTIPSIPPVISQIQTTPTNAFTPQQIYEFTEKHGEKYGVDPSILRHIALCESGLRPEAFNHIYAGLYQFSPSTWVSWRTKMGKASDLGLRFDANESIETAAYVLSQKKGFIWPNCMP